ncbi:MAG TPA: M90 family metallopeptidase [Sedimentisphaerales bacterium]|nr:M90 family metallopeptidase [Sedimentisphaerales bacterium]
MIAIDIAAAVVVLIVVFFAAKHAARVANRKRLLAAGLPDEYARIIEKNVPLYTRLPDSVKRQLGGLINIFLAEKHFEGCGGLEITDEIKVTIAAQACVLLLNRKTRYFPKLRTILVYPHTYVAKTVSSEGGLVVEERSVRLGESWQRGPVVLAWDSVTGGTSNTPDAQNVVIHEFAHQLDQEGGDADGAPILEDHSRYRAWAQVLSAEYKALQRKKERRSRSVMDKYGATDPAEFFAVATETFFEKSGQMRKNHPELYEELKDYYKLDPAEWA